VISVSLDILQYNVVAGGILRAVCLSVWVFLPGCQESLKLPLQFDHQEIELGVVRGGSKIRQEFPFTVAGKGDVLIGDLRSSCQCMAVSSAKVGERLKPGERGVVTLELAVDEYGGDFVGSINVITIPESPVPITLRVHGVALSYPQVAGEQPIIVNVPLGEGFEINVNVFAQRPEGEPKYVPDIKQSRLCGFHVESHESVEAPLLPQGAQVVTGVRERHVFRMQHEPVLTPTSRRETLEIAWKGIDHRASVAVKIIARHPLSLSTANPFLGFVKPGDKIDTTFLFARELKCAANEISFELTSEGEGSASLSPDGKGIHISLIAPTMPGRFTRSWRVISPDQGIPPLEVKVAGIVR
jgi:Protein of unknown function (DUF1573)